MHSEELCPLAADFPRYDERLALHELRYSYLAVNPEGDLLVDGRLVHVEAQVEVEVLAASKWDGCQAVCEDCEDERDRKYASR